MLVPGLTATGDLHTTAVATATAINPVIDLNLPPGPAPGKPDDEISIGLGRHVPNNLDLYLDWIGGRGELTLSPAPGTWDPNSTFGAAAAAVLGAAALFQLAHDQPVRAARFNPVELTADDNAGTQDRSRPIDIGTALVIGAGAVAAALIYWARQLRTDGAAWDIIDADDAELHNTNRCMTMTAADAGWPDGTPSGAPVDKATAAAWAIGATPHPHWYDQWLPQHDTGRHDLVLTLANGRGVRAAVAQRAEPLLLHATTSANWTAELHRRLPDRDDCPACRLPDTTQPTLDCATGPTIPTQPDSPDAALPFLSAAAGLLLAAALADLNDAAAVAGRFNHWQLDLTFATPLLRARQHPPRDGCTHILSASIRHLVQADAPRRWNILDSAAR